MRDAVLLVFANKQDLPQAMTAAEAGSEALLEVEYCKSAALCYMLLIIWFSQFLDGIHMHQCLSRLKITQSRFT